MYIPNHILLVHGNHTKIWNSQQTAQRSCHENHHHLRKKSLLDPMPKHFHSNKKKAMNSYLNITEFWIEKSSMFILTFFSCLLGTFNISEERRKLTSNAVWQTHKMGLHISDLCVLEPSKSTIKTSLSQAVRSRTSSAIFWKICVQWQVITAWQ